MSSRSLAIQIPAVNYVRKSLFIQIPPDKHYLDRADHHINQGYIFPERSRS